MTAGIIFAIIIIIEMAIACCHDEEKAYNRAYKEYVQERQKEQQKQDEKTLRFLKQLRKKAGYDIGMIRELEKING